MPGNDGTPGRRLGERNERSRVGGRPGLPGGLVLMVVMTVGLMVPTHAGAQSCTALPVARSGAFAGGQYGTDPEWGGEVGYTSPGAFGLRGQYLWEPPVDDPSVQNEQHEVSLLGTISLEAGALELCPGLGLELEIRLRTPVNRDVWSVPVGVGVGREVPLSEAVSVTPFLFPQAVYVTGRPNFERFFEDGFQRSVRTDSEAVDARLDFGAVLSTGRFYVSAVARLEAYFEAPEGTRAGLDRPLMLTVGWVF